MSDALFTLAIVGVGGSLGAWLAHRVLVDPVTKATTATIRRKLITVPARIATSARRITLHLPHAWPWQTAWTELFDRVSDPPEVLAT